eukprot:701476-Rhodomonas_salina.2
MTCGYVSVCLKIRCAYVQVMGRDAIEEEEEEEEEDEEEEGGFPAARGEHSGRGGGGEGGKSAGAIEAGGTARAAPCLHSLC